MLTSKSITFMNQFINKNYSGRGSTPAHFVTRYMARNDATLTVYPVSTSNYTMLDRNDSEAVYQKQRELLINRRLSFDKMRPTASSWFNLTTLEGRAFDQDNISLSRSYIHERADAMQQAFKDGHTVLTIVSSFDNDYLKSLGVEQPVAKNFHENVDEMKLRLAVQAGCNELADELGYTDPLFVGSIQLDRDHPHAHIAMCETAPAKHSNARRFYDGSEWGRVSRNQRLGFCYAVDRDLTENRNLVFFPSNGIEQSQKTSEMYSKKYSILPEQHKAVMVASLPIEDPYAEAMLESLCKSLHSAKPINKRTLRSKLKRQMDYSRRTHKPRKNMPEIIALQSFDAYHLKKKNGKLAKLMYKIKEAQEQIRQCKDDQDQLLNAYFKFKTIAANEPENKELIEDKVLPFYQMAIRNSSLKLDENRAQTFKPIHDVPQSIKDEQKFLQLEKLSATTPFEKDSLQREILEKTIEWQQKGYVNNQDVIKVLNDRPGHFFIPKPVSYGLKDFKVTKNIKANIKNSSDYQDYLATEAMPVVEELDKNHDLLIEKSALHNYINNIDVQVVNNEFDPSLYETSSLIQPAQKQTQFAKEEPKKEAISYQDADDLLFDVMN